MPDVALFLVIEPAILRGCVCSHIFNRNDEKYTLFRQMLDLDRSPEMTNTQTP